MRLSVDDFAAMFGYAYDIHHKVDEDERRSLREGLIESMIEWLLRHDGDVAKSIIWAARLRSPGRLISVSRQGTIAHDGRRTDVDLGFTNGVATIELKVGADFSEGQLNSYCDELARARRRHPGNYRTYLLVLTRAADRPKAERAVQSIRKRRGVDVRIITFDTLAERDSRWTIVARTAEELVSPRKPVAGSSDVFADPAVAAWAEAALRELGGLRSSHGRLRLARAMGRPRSATRLGPQVPKFSVDQRNDRAAYFIYWGSKRFACIDIDPEWVRHPDDGALIWVRFPAMDDWIPFPSSRPTKAVREAAGAAVEAVWQVLWIVVRRLRAVGWETPRPQPPVTEDGLVGVRLARETIDLILTFDPRWTTWRSHGPISIIAGDLASHTDREAWHLERNLGASSLDRWIEKAAEAVIVEATTRLESERGK